jgi:hypothetical protein
VFIERTSVGLDVHARWVAAAAIDSVSGELFQAKLTPSYDHIGSWGAGLPGPVAVAYEAGPTGFGLYRHLRTAGIRWRGSSAEQAPASRWGARRLVLVTGRPRGIARPLNCFVASNRQVGARGATRDSTMSKLTPAHARR